METSSRWEVETASTCLANTHKSLVVSWLTIKNSIQEENLKIKIQLMKYEGFSIKVPGSLTIFQQSIFKLKFLKNIFGKRAP